MHVGMIATFEAPPLLDSSGELRLGEIGRHVNRRLDQLPRLRRSLTNAPLGVIRPHWSDDPDFDIDFHLDEIKVGKPGPDGSEDLKAFHNAAERILETPLDRERPMWHLRFVTGWSKHRVGLVERAHHALIDGVSGVEIESALLDLEPTKPPRKKSEWEPQPPPSLFKELLGGSMRLSRQASSLLNPLETTRSAVKLLRTSKENAITVARSIETLARDGILAERSSVLKQVDGRRRLEFATADLEKLRLIGREHDATINDVTLNAVSEGIRSLLISRGEAINPDKIFRVLIPVSVRQEAEQDALGNRVGLMLVSLPIGINDPKARLEEIARITKRVKKRGEAATTDIALNAANALPANTIGIAAGVVNHQPFVHMVVTNVPGPPVPLYLLGSQLLSAFPVVPLGGNMTIGVAALSYNGSLSLGITAGGSAIDDVEVFRSGVEKCLSNR